MKLKMLRESLNINQKKAAELIGIPYHNYNKYELNQNEPDIETLKKMATFFNVSIDFLLDFDSTNKQQKLTDEQKQALEILLKLNQLNFVKAFSYIAGLYASQN